MLNSPSNNIKTNYAKLEHGYNGHVYKNDIENLNKKYGQYTKSYEDFVYPSPKRNKTSEKNAKKIKYTERNEYKSYEIITDNQENNKIYASANFKKSDNIPNNNITKQNKNKSKETKRPNRIFEPESTEENQNFKYFNSNINEYNNLGYNYNKINKNFDINKVQ